MKELLRIRVEDILPEAVEVLRQQGVQANAPEAQLIDLAESARRTLLDKVQPAGLLVDIDPAELARIYEGDGLNEAHTPLARIIPQARGAALFAVTAGATISERISELFDERDFAAASALDAAASLATDTAAAVAQETFAARGLADGYVALRYSPGYCGWHISGQRALFAKLEPAEIGLELTDSFLMKPLKSVSGVILTGPPEIHSFKADFPFCADCADRQCRTRILER